MNEGDLFSVDTETILVQRVESFIADTFKLGSEDEKQIAFFLKFDGRLNNTSTMVSATVAISPPDALRLALSLIDGVEYLMKEEDDGT